MARINSARITLGCALADWRVRQGLTQRDVSVRLGYSSAQFVSNWERGLSFPPMGEVRPLASILGVSVRTLVFMIFRCKQADLALEQRRVLTILGKKAG